MTPSHPKVMSLTESRLLDWLTGRRDLGALVRRPYIAANNAIRFLLCTLYVEGDIGKCGT